MVLIFICTLKHVAVFVFDNNTSQLNFTSQIAWEIYFEIVFKFSKNSWLQLLFEQLVFHSHIF